MIRFACPSCATPVKAPDSAAGKTVRCPKCYASLSIQAGAGDGVADPPPPAAGTLTATCPGCGRKIPVAEHELESPLQCAKCDTTFVPMTRQTVSASPVSDPEPSASVPTPTLPPAVTQLTPVRIGLIAGAVALVGCCGVCLLAVPNLPRPKTAPLSKPSEVAAEQPAAPERKRPRPPSGGTYMGGDSNLYLLLFADLDPQTHFQGLQGLQVIRDRTAIRGLIRQLEGSDVRSHREDAANCLGAIGETAWEAIPALKKAAESDPSQNVRERSRWALGMIGE